jgi:uncharacterized delta-60 repeat protein
MKKIINFLVVITLTFTTQAQQAGSLDTSFTPLNANNVSLNSEVSTTSLQSDGKIIIGGFFTTINGTARNYIARLNADATLDTTFNPETDTNAFGHIKTISLQPDGKIIIGGYFTTYDQTTPKSIARLNADGTLDGTFNTGTGASNNVNTTSLQSDGKIIIGGYFTTFNGTARNGIARLNSDGTLDATFNPGTGAILNFNNLDYPSDVNTISLQPDGKIIIGGNFTTYNQTVRNGIARLNTDGTLDTTFNSGTGANNVNTTSLQLDGKIIIGGSFTTYNGTARNRIARLNVNGTLDTTFNPGTGTNYNVNTTSLQSNGKIIIGGEFTYYNGTARIGIARLNTDGTLDATFNPGTGSYDIYSALIQSDGKIIIGGAFNSYNQIARKGIARINTDGTLDGTFNPTTGANDNVNTTSIQSDGKIIIGGNFTTYYETARNRIARLSANGTLDTTFNPGTGANDIVSTTSIQSDGKIIIGGNFTTYNGTLRNYIARININGTLDATFNQGTGTNSSVSIVSLQPDGKIIIGGNFTAYNGTAINYIARLNSNGTLDTTFNQGTGANSSISSVSIQSDGKIIIGGNFTTYNGTSRNKIARLNTDGTLDTTFNIGTGANYNVNTTNLLPDGKIIIGGSFTSYNGTLVSRIARLNTNGTLDTTFNQGTGANSFVRITKVQSDGKIIIAGNFTTYNGMAINKFARLNTDGTLDTAFYPGNGADSDIFSTSLQSDGKIIIGGGFSSYDGTPSNRVARINGGESLATTSFDKNEMIIYPNPVKNLLNLSMNENVTIDRTTILDITGKVVLEQTKNISTINVEKLAKGVYILTIYARDKKYQEKFIKE